MKIKIEVDGLTLEHATDLTKFLISLKTIPEDGEQETFSIKSGEINVDKPKATRKRAEKVEVQTKDEGPEVLHTAGNPADTSQEPVKVEAPIAQIQEDDIEAKEVEAIEVVEPETVSAPTLMQIRSLVAQKAAEHKDAIKAKLVELGAQNVSTLDAKHFQTIFDFLTAL